MIYKSEINDFYSMEIDMDELVIKETFDEEVISLMTTVKKENIQGII